MFYSCDQSPKAKRAQPSLFQGSCTELCKELATTSGFSSQWVFVALKRVIQGRKEIEDQPKTRSVGAFGYVLASLWEAALGGTTTTDTTAAIS